MKLDIAAWSKISWLQLILSALLLVVSANSRASDRVLSISPANTKAVALAPYFSVLEDPTQSLSISEIQQPVVAQKFSVTPAMAETLNYGFSRSAYWFRLTLNNPSDTPVDRLIDVNFPTLSSVQFHQPQANGSYHTLNTGVAEPFSTRAYHYRFFAFPITLPAGATQTFYLRVQSVSGIMIPATLWETQDFRMHERNEFAIQAAYFGLALALIIYNLALFFALRDIAYLLYSIFASLMALAVSAANGFGMEFLWPQSSFWSNISLNVLYSLALTALLIFIIRVLDIKLVAPKVHILLMALTVAMSMSTIALVVSMETFAESVSIFWALWGVVVLGALLYCAHYKGHRIAALIAVAFSMLLAGGLIVLLKTLTLIPNNSFTEQGLQLGSALEMLILAFTLAFRFSQIRRQASMDVRQANSKLELRLHAREAELTATHVQLRMVEHRQTLSDERQRLMQDMHDGMGSSLASALRVVESGHLDEAEIAQVLKNCIDDLKFAIDSLEPVDADLLLLLATFRFRLGPRLEACGIQLKWEVKEVPALDWLEPNTSLHVLRILQEAFANIIKHANATEITLATLVQDDYVVISVCDNGCGFAQKNQMPNASRGLSNQQRRAKTIGGEISWQSSSKGTCLTLQLPLSDNRRVAA
jgi:signal transduction histidine kinase